MTLQEVSSQYISQYTTVYHSISQYTTVHHSILQYTTVHHAIPQCILPYLSVHYRWRRHSNKENVWPRVALTSEHFCCTDESNLRPGHHISKQEEQEYLFDLSLCILHT